MALKVQLMKKAPTTRRLQVMVVRNVEGTGGVQSTDDEDSTVDKEGTGDEERH